MTPQTIDLARNVVARVVIEQEVLEASRAILSIKTADEDFARLREAWARPENLRVIAGIFDRVKDKIKSLVPQDILKTWEKARGVLKRFTNIFKNPKAVAELSKMIGEITPANIKSFLKSGQKALKAALEPIRIILTEPSGLPTLTDLIKRTAIGAGIAEEFSAKVRPRADAVDVFLKKHVPNLRRVAVAAAFTVVWLNVDELSWDMPSLAAGFSGGMSLADLLASLPESAIGAVSSAVFGIGYTIMPYMILTRVLWLVAGKLLIWDGKSLKPNWKLVEKSSFFQAHKQPQYAALAF